MKKILLLSVIAIILSAFSMAAPYAVQSYNNQRTYYNQMNYNANGAGYGYNYAAPSTYARNAGQYAVLNRHDGFNGNGPFLYPTRSYNPNYGYRTTYSSHFYIDSPIDQAYARNPSMLEPRRMMNTQRQHRGFYYTW
jgi:hypothetical protein